MTQAPALFIADARGIDFLNSIAIPLDEEVEWLDSGEGLLRWLDQGGLVDAGLLAGFRASTMPGELDAVAAQARSLREWFRGFVLKHRGEPLGDAALREIEPLNRILERDEAYTQIVERQQEEGTKWRSGLAIEKRRRWRSPDTLLLPIAEAMAQVVAIEDFTHIKSCEGNNCRLMFVDNTHSHGRRWCSMAVCGNRAKQAAHRRGRTAPRA